MSSGVVVWSWRGAAVVALRSFGARVGLPVAGFVGGFVSTATVAAMGERCARTPSLLRPAIAGAVISSVATVVLGDHPRGDSRPQSRWPTAACSGAAALAYGALFMVRSLRDG
jgi:hypothetical protein